MALSLAEEATLRDPMGIWCSPYFQDTSNDGDMPPTAAAVAVGAHLLGFSDEILLHILSHVPSTDLVLNVRRTCRKLAVLCLDKSLTHTVLLQKDYEVRHGLQGWWWCWCAGRAGDGSHAHLRTSTAWQRCTCGW